MKLIDQKDKFDEILSGMPLPFTGHGSLTENYQKIKTIYETREELFDFTSIYAEICTCLTLGLNQASITLTNHLLEKSLLIALIYFDAFNNDNNKSHLNLNEFFTDEINEYNDFMLEKKIKYCFEKGLVTEEHRANLDLFRNKIRNAFSHSNLKKMFGDATVDSKLLSVEDNQLKIEDAKLVLWQSLFTQVLSQAMLAENIASDYFIYIDSVNRYIHNKIFNDKNNCPNK